MHNKVNSCAKCANESKAGEAYVIEIYGGVKSVSPKYRVQCFTCYRMGGRAPTKNKAIAIWNSSQLLVRQEKK